MERFKAFVAEGNEDAVSSRAGGAGRRNFDPLHKGSYYTESRHKPETPMELLRRNISVGIEREKTNKLQVGGLRIMVQKSFENSLLQDKNDFRKKKASTFAPKPQPRTNYYPGTQSKDAEFDLPFDPPTRRELKEGIVSVPLVLLPELSSKKSTKSKSRSRTHRQYPVPPMPQSEYMAKRRSAQFHVIKRNGPRPSAAFALQLQQKDSFDSLDPVMGSFQDENEKQTLSRKSLNARKSRRQSQAPVSSEQGPPPTTDAEEEEGEFKIKKVATMGKIRFETPEGSENPTKNPTTQKRLKSRRPTSVRTTRFTVPRVDDADDTNNVVTYNARRPPSTAGVTKTKSPRFQANPEKHNLDMKASEKIRERRPTPMFNISPMFALLAKQNDDRHTVQDNTNVPGFNFPPVHQGGNLGLFQSVILRQRANQKIQQRNKAPEPNEAAHEFKKGNMPAKNAKGIDITNSFIGAASDKLTSSDVNAPKVVEEEYEEPPPGLMRVKKRRNMGGRLLSPPFSRNERSNSLTVMDFRNSIFYKRAKAAMPRKSLQTGGNHEAPKRQLLNVVSQAKPKQEEVNATADASKTQV